MSVPLQGLVDFAASLVALGQEKDTPDKPEVGLAASSSRLPSVSHARHALEDGGVSGYARWLRSSPRVLVADGTLERLQSRFLGGRVRTADLRELAAEVVRLVPEYSCLEVSSCEAVGRALGGSRECPWRRIEEIRDAAPGLVLRATVSAATALGGAVTPPRTLEKVAVELAHAGVDIIRVADPFNDADRLSAAVDAVARADVVVEGSVCASGALHPTSSAGYVEAAVAVAATLERHGVQVVALEDDLGVLRPIGAYSVVRAIRREVQVPVWVRFTESSGFALAAVLSAVEAGAVGVDTVLPSLVGAGYEPGVVPLTTSLADTEREPEISPALLLELDRRLASLVTLLGGQQLPMSIVPDGADRGVPPLVLNRVLDARQRGSVSLDHAVAACEAAWNALGEPASVAPAREALIELATQLLDGEEAAGRLLDRARADDPQGLLDSVASLREGGFPELPMTEQQASDRRELIAELWPEDAAAFRKELEAHGELELVPGAPCLYGLGPGEAVTVLVDGVTHEVRAVQGEDNIDLELDGKPTNGL